MLTFGTGPCRIASWDICSRFTAGCLFNKIYETWKILRKPYKFTTMMYSCVNCCVTDSVCKSFNLINHSKSTHTDSISVPIIFVLAFTIYTFLLKFLTMYRPKRGKKHHLFTQTGVHTCMTMLNHSDQSNIPQNTHTDSKLLAIIFFLAFISNTFLLHFLTML